MVGYLTLLSLSWSDINRSAKYAYSLNNSSSALPPGRAGFHCCHSLDSKNTSKQTRQFSNSLQGCSLPCPHGWITPHDTRRSVNLELNRKFLAEMGMFVSITSQWFQMLKPLCWNSFIATWILEFTLEYGFLSTSTCLDASYQTEWTKRGIHWNPTLLMFSHDRWDSVWHGHELIATVVGGHTAVPRTWATKAFRCVWSLSAGPLTSPETVGRAHGQKGEELKKQRMPQSNSTTKPLTKRH